MEALVRQIVLTIGRAFIPLAVVLAFTPAPVQPSAGRCGVSRSEWKSWLMLHNCNVGERFTSPATPSPSPTPTPTPSLTNTPTPSPSPTNTPTPRPKDDQHFRPKDDEPLAQAETPTLTPTPKPTPIPVTSQQLDEWFTKYSNLYSVDRQKLWDVAVCESNLNPNATNGPYAGLYQFTSSSWISTRKIMNMSPDPLLRLNPEEAIRTTAFKMSTVGLSPWPNCGK